MHFVANRWGREKRVGGSAGRWVGKVMTLCKFPDRILAQTPIRRRAHTPTRFRRLGLLKQKIEIKGPSC